MSMTEQSSRQVARPLEVLVPLIKQDVVAGKKAGLEHFRSAGDKLLEAKSDPKLKGKFEIWVKQTFPFGLTQAKWYMRLAKTSNVVQTTISTLEDFQEVQGSKRRSNRKAGGARETIVSRAQVEAFRAEQQSRGDERELQRQLAYTLIDIGFKVLATKFHPDKGGSADAMVRLNTVRVRLKAHA